MIKLGKYNPRKVVRKGKVSIIDEKYVIKEEKENNEILDYLKTRNFHYFPNIIERDENLLVSEYIENIEYPDEQKLYDLIDLTSLLHSKTTYFKETDESKFNQIYEDISNNILFLRSYYSDKITLMVDQENFYASAEGEFGDANIEYLHGEKIDTKAKSIFSLEKIREMLKADKFSEIATICLGNDMPLTLSLKMVSEDGELSFLLAPRIESEE